MTEIESGIVEAILRDGSIIGPTSARGLLEGGDDMNTAGMNGLPVRINGVQVGVVSSINDKGLMKIQLDSTAHGKDVKYMLQSESLKSLSLRPEPIQAAPKQYEPCANCLAPIKVTIYHGTGWCSEKCRKILKGEK